LPRGKKTYDCGVLDRNGYPKCLLHASAALAYAHIWESINGKGSWDINPFVWAITFKRIQP
jgi:hypothetical protein